MPMIFRLFVLFVLLASVLYSAQVPTQTINGWQMQDFGESCGGCSDHFDLCFSVARLVCRDRAWNRAYHL